MSFPAENPEIAAIRGEKLSGVQTAAVKGIGFSGRMAL